MDNLPDPHPIWFYLRQNLIQPFPSSSSATICPGHLPPFNNGSGLPLFLVSRLLPFALLQSNQRVALNMSTMSHLWTKPSHLSHPPPHKCKVLTMARTAPTAPSCHTLFQSLISSQAGLLLSLNTSDVFLPQGLCTCCFLFQELLPTRHIPPISWFNSIMTFFLYEDVRSSNNPSTAFPALSFFSAFGTMWHT